MLDLYQSQVLAFYDPLDHTYFAITDFRRRCRALGERGPRCRQSVVVHELTHALQDQRFGAGARDLALHEGHRRRARLPLPARRGGVAGDAGLDDGEGGTVARRHRRRTTSLVNRMIDGSAADKTHRPGRAALLRRVAEVPVPRRDEARRRRLPAAAAGRDRHDGRESAAIDARDPSSGRVLRARSTGRRRLRQIDAAPSRPDRRSPSSTSASFTGAFSSATRARAAGSTTAWWWRRTSTASRPCSPTRRGRTPSARAALPRRLRSVPARPRHRAAACAIDGACAWLRRRRRR